MTDLQLQQYVQSALGWEPSIDAADVGVTVENGVVTLRGDVRSYSERAAAERVALRVHGVKAVANDLTVRLPGRAQRTDSDIAQAAFQAFRWNTMIPDEGVSVSVSNGWVTLKGEVAWNFQRDAAMEAVRDLTGVRGVTNNIMVRPRVSAVDVKSKIEAALKRSAEVDAGRINVGVTDGKVTLTGQVRSWVEREEAEHAAWAAPGVKEVEDRIAVMP